MLGVVIESNFSFSAHLSRTISCASQSLYALKVLKNSGLPQLALSRVCSGRHFGVQVVLCLSLLVGPYRRGGPPETARGFE